MIPATLGGLKNFQINTAVDALVDEVFMLDRVLSSGGLEQVCDQLAGAANQPPSITSDNDPVVVDEGDTANNTGTVRDADGDTVTLSASSGTVVNNGDGTWSWSFDTADGSDDSQTITITADDDNEGITSTQFVLTVNNTAPDCSNASPSQDSLWPANHKLAPITIQGVTDVGGDTVSINIDSIWQDEAVNGRGDANTSPDGAGVGTDTAEVRAERSGKGDGRVYSIVFSASDEEGATCTGSVEVDVPHDKKDPAVNSGTTFNSIPE